MTWDPGEFFERLDRTWSELIDEEAASLVVSREPVRFKRVRAILVERRDEKRARLDTPDKRTDERVSGPRADASGVHASQTVTTTRQRPLSQPFLAPTSSSSSSSSSPSSSSAAARRSAMTTSCAPSTSEGGALSKAGQAKSLTDFLHGVKVHFVRRGLGKVTLSIFKANIEKHGGVVSTELNSSTTHVVSTLDYAGLLSALKLVELPSDKHFVSVGWMYDIAKHGTTTRPHEEPYAIQAPNLPSPVKSPRLLRGDGLYGYTREAAMRRVSSRRVANSGDSPVGPQSSDVEEGREEEEEEQEGEEKGEEEDAVVVSEAGRRARARIEEMRRAGAPFMQKAEPKNMGSFVFAVGSSSRIGEKTGAIGKGDDKQSHVSLVSQVEKNNVNAHLTGPLTKMMTLYKAEGGEKKWNALGYRKAISALQRHGKRIESMEEARVLHGIGAKIADHIGEILLKGTYEKFENVPKDTHVIADLERVWGVGQSRARQWMEHGVRSCEEAIARRDELRQLRLLDRRQSLALEYFYDLQERMPRDEAGEIGARVGAVVKEVCAGATWEVCGSYRRLKETCGDVDVLVTNPGGDHEGILACVIERLFSEGFLLGTKASLSSRHEWETTRTGTGAVREPNTHDKYMGVCRLSPTHRARRLDIICVPSEEYACSLLYFTGSDYTNRSMRKYAKDRGMSLSQHALRINVARGNGDKISVGEALVTPTEQSVYEALGVAYQPPQERNH